jgi:hypothetical protein
MVTAVRPVGVKKGSEVLQRQAERVDRQWVEILELWLAAREKGDRGEMDLWQGQWEECVRQGELLEDVQKLAGEKAEVADARWNEIALYERCLEAFEEELVARRQQIHELHGVIERQAEALAELARREERLSAAEERPARWWRFWARGEQRAGA